MNHQKLFLLISILVFFSFFLNPKTIAGSLHHGIKRKPPLIPGINVPDSSGLQNYIIQVRKPKELQLKTEDDFKRWHISILESVAPAVVSRLIYSYDTVLNGFAVSVTKEELAAISKASWFVHADPDRAYTLQTTRSPHFLGLQLGRGVWNATNLGKGIIIGIVDSGITPNHPSFDPTGMPRPPDKWKGECDLGPYVCNNKIIGARSFVTVNGTIHKTAVDEYGHGTHTASIAAGRLVQDANVFGQARGWASGIAPLAHLAVYRVCDGYRCSSASIVKGINAAVQDGVDVLSLAVGEPRPRAFYYDSVAVGTFGAIKKGVFASAAAGNDGPSPYSISNDAPWILTVAASNLDRTIMSTLMLGNGTEIDGQTLTQPHDYRSIMFPVVYPGNNGDVNAITCAGESFDGVDVKGKIVLCESGGNISRATKGLHVRNAGGAGMILMNTKTDAYTIHASINYLPAASISHADGLKVKAYIKSSKNPTAKFVFKGTVTNGVRAPQVASFSSRGPSKATPGILKPDITGPGVNILAAAIKLHGQGLNRHVIPTFYMDTGTSMACPHFAGIAALLKSIHPQWTPAMIKSAIMTTSYVLDNTGKPILNEKHSPASYFEMGTGHVNITKATDPGLVYDIEPGHYLRYLCGLGYNNTMMGRFPDCPIDCEELVKVRQDWLNYPSITVAFTTHSHVVNIKRTVTNVGEARSMYSAKVKLPQGVSMLLRPSVLLFNELKQKRKFKMTFWYKEEHTREDNFLQGELKWVSSKHEVRSPISIVFNQTRPLL